VNQASNNGSDATLGFVGLGAIGSVLAGTLAGAGHELVVFDTRPEAVQALLPSGALPADSPLEVANRARTVFTSLPSPQALRDVALGHEGLSRGAAIRALVDLSTVGSSTAEAVAAGMREAGVSYVDAPVSGGVAGARAGRLTVMAGGDRAALTAVEPLLGAFAANVFWVGPEPGQGQLAKLLNNLLSATALLITSEATTLAVRAGLDPATLLEVFNASTGRNTATSDKFPLHVLTRKFEAGFRLKLMAKDVGLALTEAERLGAPMVLAGLVQQLWTLAAERAQDEDDVTEIVRMYEDWLQVVVEQTEVASAGC
jgi:3-hydroxyisobutyrate dehydrogenase-like beta-hydroxyacid dehydrogenase